MTVFVVMSGRPGSGKSTLAARLAPVLGLSLLVKDDVKRALVDVLGGVDVEQSREFGRAARRVLMAVAATSAGAVLDSVWPPGGPGPDRPVDEIGALPGTVVEVHCDVDPELARQRYRTRSFAAADDPLRDLDEQAVAGVVIGGGWPVLHVDTSVPADLGAVVAWIRAAVDG